MVDRYLVRLPDRGGPGCVTSAYVAAAHLMLAEPASQRLHASARERMFAIAYGGAPFRDAPSPACTSSPCWSHAGLCHVFETGGAPIWPWLLLSEHTGRCRNDRYRKTCRVQPGNAHRLLARGRRRLNQLKALEARPALHSHYRTRYLSRRAYDSDPHPSSQLHPRTLDRLCRPRGRVTRLAPHIAPLSAVLPTFRQLGSYNSLYLLRPLPTRSVHGHRVNRPQRTTRSPTKTSVTERKKPCSRARGDDTSTVSEQRR